MTQKKFVFLPNKPLVIYCDQKMHFSIVINALDLNRPWASVESLLFIKFLNIIQELYFWDSVCGCKLLLSFNMIFNNKQSYLHFILKWVSLEKVPENYENAHYVFT